MTLGFGLVAAYATLGLFLHHMFIIDVHSAVGLLFFAFPALLILAGAVLTLRAFVQQSYCVFRFFLAGDYATPIQAKTEPWKRRQRAALENAQNVSHFAHSSGDGKFRKRAGRY